MIELDEDKLKRVQATELDMLLVLDSICRKYNIRYSLDGGTLLGAVRHHGFIPWDDDVDVCMMRKEYNKFYRVCQKELNQKKYFLQEFRTDRSYPWGYSKLRRNGTLFLREGQEHVKCHQGIFLDIFIYDNVPDNPVIRNLYHFACFCVRKCQYAVVGKRTDPSVALRILYSVLDRIPKEWLYKATLSLSRVSDEKKTQLARHITYPYPKRCFYGLPRRCFDEYTETEFAGHQLMVFQESHLYLKTLYGDYRTLPPESERKTHPVTRLRLPKEI